MGSYVLKINGATHTVEASADMPLLWVLRDKLGLMGTKFGCGIAQCGACLVHINGVAEPACVMSVADAAGKDIVTIEGLAQDGRHPVQQAWLEMQVPQCGYCQSGQIMAATALLEKNRRPSDADIDAAMDRVLCRCGTYQRIRRAIHHAARQMAAGRKS
jgi:isoquinoline 1-oxidoreductase alpha subunit